MNHRKTIFGFCITLGMLVGGVLAIVTGALLLGALMGGAILGALGFLAIDGVVSRRRTSLLPYDQLDEHHRVSNPGHHQTPEAQFRQIQDGHIDQYMPFHLGKPRQNVEPTERKRNRTMLTIILFMLVVLLLLGLLRLKSIRPKDPQKEAKEILMQVPHDWR